MNDFYCHIQCEQLDAKCEKLEATNAELCEEVQKLEALNAELLEALESIAEFWNRDQNEKAMIGACWHAIETAEAAIAKAKGEQP